MSRDAVAIVAPAFNFEENSRAILKEHVALQDCERQIEACERKSESLYAKKREHIAEIGRRLREQKQHIKHGGWLPYLEKMGLPERTAREWIDLADHADGPKSAPDQSGADLPSRRQRAAARAQAKPADPPPRTSSVAATELDIDRELSRLNMKIIAFAESAPAKARRQIAHELRQTASMIESLED